MKLRRFVRFLIVVEAISLFICAGLVGYRIAKDETRELTEAEKQAEETTAKLKAERSSYVDDTEDYCVSIHSVADSDGDIADNNTDEKDEVEDAIIIETDRFIVEEPEVYEEYHQEETETEVYTTESKWQNGEYQFTSDEIWEMTRIVYLENGITYPECTYKTVYLTACVILNRLYDWDECNTVYDVIWQAGQYSTANRYEDYDGSALGTSNPEGWEISEQAVWDAIENTDRNPHFQSRAIQGEVYYVDPYLEEYFCY